MVLCLLSLLTLPKKNTKTPTHHTTRDLVALPRFFFQGPNPHSFLLIPYHQTAIMSVVGVDFGTLQTVIAVARNRGVDVVRSA